MSLPIMTRTAELNGLRPPKVGKVGRVRLMACHTLALLYGLVFGRRLCEAFHGVCMAAAADGNKGTSNELRFPGTMGSMTAKAALLAQHGPVNAVPVQGIIHHVAMTAPAQFKSCLLRLKWGGRTWLFMALVAEPVRNRYVGVRVKECPLV